jgi:hypothetical protein
VATPAGYITAKPIVERKPADRQRLKKTRVSQRRLNGAGMVTHAWG